MESGGFKKLIFSGAVIFLLAPLFVFSQDTSITLKEKQSIDILDIIRKFPLNEAQSEFYYQSLYYPMSDYPEKTGAVMLVKQSILQEQLDYWFIKAPYELSKKFIKAIYKLLPLVAYGDFSGAIDLIEKFTVEQANQYIDSWLKQNQVQIGSGIGKYTFKSFKNNWQVINIPYIIVYSPTIRNKANIVVEFYSKTAIEPPQDKGGVGSLGGNQDHVQSTVWPLDIWVQSSGQKSGLLQPFIVRVKGQVVKDQFGNFTWDKSVTAPTVEVDFNNPVPEIDQSDIILENLKKEQGLGFLQKKINQIKQTAQGIINQIKMFLAIFKPQAQISSFVESVASETELTGDRPLLIIGGENGNENEEDKNQNQNELTGLVDQFDDISEQSEILFSQAERFINEQNVSAVEEATEKMRLAVEQVIEKKQEDLAFEQRIVSTSQPITCSPVAYQTQEASFDEVVFNEIAWMGGKNSSADEWIELKNISIKPIDLNGWQIFNKSQGIKKIIATSSVVAPGGFWLLERTDDNSAPLVKADLIYTGAIANTDEALYLVGPNCILQDKAQAKPYWLEGDNSTKETMERNQFFGWQTSSVVGGTPKAKNSAGKIKPSSGSGGLSGNTEVNGTGAAAPPPAQQQPQSLALCSLETTSSPVFSPVIFNEIAWMGTVTSSYDEWLELKNISTSTVSLNNWQIIGKKIAEQEPSIKIFLNNKTIDAGDYFLLEKDSSSPALANIRDEVYTGGNLLNNPNPNFELYLFNQNCQLIDFIQATSSWPAGDSVAKKTMERKTDLTWQTYLGQEENGIMGTPGAENSQLPPSQNQLPRPFFTYTPTSPEVNQEVIFNASSSTDSDGTIVSYNWDFGDNISFTTTQATTTHIFSASGQFQIILVITDDRGATSTASTTISVNPLAQLAQGIVISEVQIKDKEFVELYNPTIETTSTAGWYLSYFSASRDWNKPTITWQFPTTDTIPTKSHYLIGIFGCSKSGGNPDVNWELLGKTTGKPYSDGQFSNNTGAVGIFTCDPSFASTTEAAQNCKVDAVGWGEPIVKEVRATAVPTQDSSLTRKQNQNGDYIDNNNNSLDFEIQILSPTNSKGETGNILPPSSPQNFQVANNADNAVALAWTTSTDPDSATTSISYIIYYSQEGEITSFTFTATTTAVATTTTTALTISDLYYASTYYFGIRAFDGLNYSAVATTSPLSIPAEIPQWQMAGANPSRTFQSPYLGSTTSATKYAFSLPGGAKTGPAIDQNGTIYIGVGSGLLALKEGNNALTTKWLFPASGNVFIGNPIIGPDGTVYIINADKILAVSPGGALKWQVILNHSIGASYPPQENRLNLKDSNLYLAASYIIQGNRRPLLAAFHKDSGNLLWVFDLGDEQKYNNFDEAPALNDLQTPPSLPTIGANGDVYLGFGTTLFAIDSQGNLKWKKTLEIQSNWQSQFPTPFDAISVDSAGAVYFLIKNKAYEQFIGGATSTFYANFIYVLLPNSIDVSTSAILSTETKWQEIRIEGAKSPILIDENGAVYFVNDQNNNNYLYKIALDGTTILTQITGEVYDFSPWLIDKEKKIYGRGGNFLNGFTVLDAQGQKLAFYFQDTFIFPFALSQNGILYAPSFNTLYGFGE